MIPSDRFDLARFLDAQETTYRTALLEIQSGRKVSHWMWFIFPQIAGLGSSSTSQCYAIKSLDEARAYLAHPTLGPRLIECAQAALDMQNKTAEDIFGGIDAMKLHSSATLFASVSPQGSVFHRLVDRYFDGRPDVNTRHLLEQKAES